MPAKLPQSPFALPAVAATTTSPLSTSQVIWLESSREQLAAEIQAAYDACTQAVATGDKNFIRGLHHEARGFGERIGYSTRLAALFERHLSWFKSGHEIDAEAIRPGLRLVETTADEQLWTLARACWSMPYSKGYGRRLRFLVIDEEHGGLIGALGLQSPPADLLCRDSLFEYPRGQKLELVNQTMDAYTTGAIPPYSFLLGGKLCAGLLCADDIREAYWRRYATTRTQMRGQRVRQPLVAITTTSAFGKSSQYNRLRYGDRLLAAPIGYTKGYGMLHLEHLYPKMCQFLEAQGALTPNGYGNGPKVRWQNVTKALLHLGLPLHLLAHGVQREVYLFNLTEDLEGGMAGGSFGEPLRLSVEEFGSHWRTRWAMPRALRYPQWRDLDAPSLVKQKVVEWDALMSRSGRPAP